MKKFLSGLFGSKKKQEMAAPQPGESFTVIEGTTADGNPVIGSVNRAYAEFTGKAEAPWYLCLAASLPAEELFESGLPHQSASNTAHDFEDELLTHFATLCTAHFIGHAFTGGQFEMHVYLSDPEEVHNYLQSMIRSETQKLPLGYEIAQDPQWENVEILLH